MADTSWSEYTGLRAGGGMVAIWIVVEYLVSHLQLVRGRKGIKFMSWFSLKLDVDQNGRYLGDAISAAESILSEPTYQSLSGVGWRIVPVSVVLLALALALALVSSWLIKRMGFKASSFLKVALVLSAVLAGYLMFFCFLVWNVPFVDVPDSLRKGEFGDSFGTLNALFSGLAFSGVLITLLIQRKDLLEAREQSARQQIESQFYNMLSLQQQIVQAFDLHGRGDKGRVAVGRDCFRIWVNKIKKEYSGWGKQFDFADSQERAVKAYGSIMVENKGDLGLYYRSLYSIFRFVESSDYSDKKGFPLVVRSLLSDYELVMLYYNCLTGDGEKFKRFAVAHALFDNLDVTLLAAEEHVVFMEKAAYGDNSTALQLAAKIEQGRPPTPVPAESSAC
ncbi:putative phage abortive infection protein [Pseudomonas entomophila]|uniref:putative phage abortive infection protein n=1 Tax=Pseudomonas entomophila TaxID=312306 RepID=UPI00240563E6|nr:putative phage abortive infection protein [Pseudomonas entomophila]MDF9619535.1 putative phage abortive infection protein [Pseudomonas entomophila]